MNRRQQARGTAERQPGRLRYTPVPADGEGISESLACNAGFQPAVPQCVPPAAAPRSGRAPAPQARALSPRAVRSTGKRPLNAVQTIIESPWPLPRALPTAGGAVRKSIFPG